MTEELQPNAEQRRVIQRAHLGMLYVGQDGRVYVKLPKSSSMAPQKALRACLQNGWVKRWPGGIFSSTPEGRKWLPGGEVQRRWDASKVQGGRSDVPAGGHTERSDELHGEPTSDQGGPTGSSEAVERSQDPQPHLPGLPGDGGSGVHRPELAPAERTDG